MHHELSKERVEQFKRNYGILTEEIGKRIVGYRNVVDQVLTAMMAGGNVLLEGVPGLGKTLLVRTIGEATQMLFHRVQFTPDLMPADITGTNIIHTDDKGGRTFRFQPGPIFANLVLADEINRATPKTQSAVLEAMQEGCVTVGGTTHPLPDPFWVLATQNPIEMEGTYPLPEAQIDRFIYKIDVRAQGEDELLGIIKRTTGDEKAQLKPVLSKEQIIEMQGTVRQVLAAEFVQRYAARTGHPPRQRARHREHQEVCPLRRQPARRAIPHPLRQSPGSARGAVHHQLRGHSRGRPARPAPPHHQELRSRGRRHHQRLSPQGAHGVDQGARSAQRRALIARPLSPQAS
jgi:MoxR-like ATPase